MKKVILTIIGAAFLTAGLLSSTVADPTLDQAKETKICIARLHMCFLQEDYEALLANPPTNTPECLNKCENSSNPPGEACGIEACFGLCNIAFEIVGGFCPNPPSVDLCIPPECGG